MEEKNLPLALVTGAARRLGRAFAISLARQGFAVLVHFHHSRKEADAVVKEIESAGVPAFLFEADLTETAEVEGLFSYLDALPHTLRVLVNSAAIMPRSDIQTLSGPEWDSVMALNLRAPFLVSQRAAARMQAGGLIVNITDAGAKKVWTSFPDYSVSKAGLEALTRLLAKALAPNIRVNAIAPGLVLPSEGISETDWQKLVGRLPLKRSTSLEELTSALEFLVKNTSVTGQTVFVDGGYSLY